MITIPGNVRVWLATGHTDMRRGFRSLALMVQEELKRDPHCGDLYLFRGRRSDLSKIIWHDGQGACLFSKPRTRPQTLLVASDGRRRCDSQCCSALVSVVRDRPADAARGQAPAGRRMSLRETNSFRQHGGGDFRRRIG